MENFGTIDNISGKIFIVLEIISSKFSLNKDQKFGQND